MSVEAWTVTPEYTITGTGPYAITHPYTAGAIRAYVRLDTGLLALNISEFAVDPEASGIEGNLTLTPTAASAHAGRTLIIDRVTPDEQGWLAVLGEREAGLAAQLDRMVQADQELRARGAGALRIRGELDAFDWAEGTVPILEGGKVRSGPSATAIAAAQAHAEDAEDFAAAAAASAAEAQSRELSMLRDRGNWATALLYTPSDIVTINGSAYICIAAHLAGVFATDLAAGRWRLFAAKGDAGAGTGDMLKTENLSGLTNYPQARTNLGLQAMATKASVAFADMAAAAVRLASEGLASPTDSELATAAWVKALMDAMALPPEPLASWTWSTNVASIPLIDLAGWDSVLVTGALGLTGSNSAKLQVSPDNGSTWRSSNYLTGTLDIGGEDRPLDGVALSRFAAGTVRFDLTLQRMSQTRSTHISGHCHHSNPRGSHIVAAHNIGEVINAMRLMDATFTSGFVEVFGLRRAVP